MAFSEFNAHEIERVDAKFRIIMGPDGAFATIDLKFQQVADQGHPASIKLYFTARHIEYARRFADAINSTLTTELCEDGPE